MALIARAQVTICDLRDPVVSGEEPSSPVLDMLWMDTSQTPSVLKRWTGEAWEVVNEPSVGGTNLFKGSAAWSDAAFENQGSATISGEILTVPAGAEDCTSHMINIKGGEQYVLSFDVRSDQVNTEQLVVVEIRNAENDLSDAFSVIDTSNTEWSRVSYKFTAPDDAAFATICFRPVGCATEYRRVKFEEGTIATSWSPAPQDTDEEVSKLSSRLTKAESTIAGNEIIDRVFQSETYINDRNEITQTKEAQAETKLALDNYMVEFSSTKQVVDGMDENFRAWFDFTREAELKIGRSDSDFSMTLSNEQLAFYYKTVLAAYMSGSKMYNPNLVVLKTLTMGDPASSSPLQAIMDNDGISWE